MSHNIEYVLDSAGCIVRRETYTSLPMNIDQVLTRVMQNAPVVAQITEDIFYVRKNDQEWYFKRADKMDILTDFTIRNGYLVPGFHKQEQTSPPPEGEATIDMKLPFRMPAECSVWYAMHGLAMYIFWKIRSDSEIQPATIRIPCLANLFADCKICTGNVRIPPTAGVLGRMEAILKACDTNRWGGDLRDMIDFELMERIMKWDMAPPYTQQPVCISDLNQLKLATGPFSSAWQTLVEWRNA